MNEQLNMYLRHNWPLFPCNGKAPLTPHGFKDASTDPQQIEAWAEAFPGCNWAVSCGPAHIAVVDIDAPDGFIQWENLLSANGYPAIETPTANTGGGGKHLVFRGGVRCGKLASSIDLKATGGYIIVAPSKHPDTGKLYEWQITPDDAELEPLPEWVTTTQPATEAASAAGCTGIPEGQRNQTLTSLAGTLRKRGMAEASIEAALLAENKERCKPPLPDSEVRAIAASVGKYDPPPEPTTTTWAEHAATLQEISWTWPKWLPNGFLTLLAARSEIGKSSLALWLAASLTDGRRLPDLTVPLVEGDVVWVDTEASQVLNYSRARAWNVDMRRFIVPTLKGATEDIALSTPEGWASLESAARRDGVVLVVVDSLGGAVSRENDESMKDFVHSLAALARDTHRAILLIHHPRKLAIGEVDEMSLDRVRGNSGIVQFCRVIWTIEVPDPFNEDTKRLRVLKSNLGQKPEALGFRITDTGLAFGDAPERPEESSKLVEAETMIRELLKDGKPVLAAAFLEEATSRNINEKTLRRAKAALRIVSEHAPEGRSWVWRMPESPK